jgi:diguanylate cyclase (GGDEF)-like protein
MAIVPAVLVRHARHTDDGMHPELVYELDGETTIGGPEDDIVVGDAGPLAVVRWHDGAWRVRPTSKHCRLDGESLDDEVVLAGGEVIECSPYTEVQFLFGSRASVLDEERNVANITDRLTGSLYRKFYAPYVTRAERPTALLYVDIDMMKKINDTFGFMGGDTTLRRTAAKLRAATRWPDVVMRIGGEEFVVVMPATTLERARERAEQIRISAEPPFDFEGDPITATLSIGIAMVGDDIWEALRSAEENEVAAKVAGRNRVVG